MKITSSRRTLIGLTGLLTPLSLEATLIAYWPMDDTTGTTAVATFGPDALWQGTEDNLVWQETGKIGGAADLSGVVLGDNFFNVDMGAFLQWDVCNRLNVD